MKSPWTGPTCSDVEERRRYLHELCAQVVDSLMAMVNNGAIVEKVVILRMTLTLFRSKKTIFMYAWAFFLPESPGEMIRLFKPTGFGTISNEWDCQRIQRANVAAQQIARLLRSSQLVIFILANHSHFTFQNITNHFLLLADSTEDQGGRDHIQAYAKAKHSPY